MCDPMTWSALATAGSAVIGNIGQGQAIAAQQHGLNQYLDSVHQAQGAMQQGASQAADAVKTYGSAASDLFSPYTLAGKQALDMYKGATGMPGGAAFNPTTSGLYQYQLGLGTDALNRQMASKGLSGSAAAMPTMARFTNQLGAEEGQRQMGYLQNMVGQGMQGAGQQANYTANMGQGLANIQSNLASAMAGLYGSAGQAQMQSGNDIATGTAKNWQAMAGLPMQAVGLYQNGQQANTMNSFLDMMTKNMSKNTAGSMETMPGIDGVNRQLGLSAFSNFGSTSPYSAPSSAMQGMLYGTQQPIPKGYTQLGNY